MNPAAMIHIVTFLHRVTMYRFTLTLKPLLFEGALVSTHVLKTPPPKSTVPHSVCEVTDSGHIQPQLSVPDRKWFFRTDILSVFC